MGRPNKIQSADQLWELFEAYKNKVKSTPFLVHEFVGKEGQSVYREKEKPLTMEGFECYCMDEGIINDLSHYFANTNGRYKRFLAICSRIRREIRADQISGGMAGLYNPSITQRLNSLVDKVQQTVIEQPLFNMDGKEDEDE